MSTAMNDDNCTECDQRKESSQNHPQIPVIDLNLFFSKEADPVNYKEECSKVAEAFHKYGVVVVRDPRVSYVDNERFINMMEKYFEKSDGIRDARPEYNFQVGVTPELTEKARDHAKLIQQFGGENKAISPARPEYDPKWRFFWRIGPLPEKTEFPALNQDQVVPLEFPQWNETMDMWGYKMLDAIFVLAEMSAVGLNLPADTFTSRLQNGPHLLAPTGSNYQKYNAEGTVLAAFHYDLNFMTIHGKCRYPGLYVWTRDGTKMPVVVPEGCLLVQVLCLLLKLYSLFIVIKNPFTF
jgi:isopenicillin N synthase-like dioxygenase